MKELKSVQTQHEIKHCISIVAANEIYANMTNFTVCLLQFGFSSKLSSHSLGFKRSFSRVIWRFLRARHHFSRSFSWNELRSLNTSTNEKEKKKIFCKVFSHYKFHFCVHRVTAVSVTSVLRCSLRFGILVDSVKMNSTTSQTKQATNWGRGKSSQRKKIALVEFMFSSVCLFFRSFFSSSTHVVVVINLLFFVRSSMFSAFFLRRSLSLLSCNICRRNGLFRKRNNIFGVCPSLFMWGHLTHLSLPSCKLSHTFSVVSLPLSSFGASESKAFGAHLTFYSNKIKLYDWDDEFYAFAC